MIFMPKMAEAMQKHTHAHKYMRHTICANLCFLRQCFGLSGIHSKSHWVDQTTYQSMRRGKEGTKKHFASSLTLANQMSKNLNNMLVCFQILHKVFFFSLFIFSFIFICVCREKFVFWSGSKINSQPIAHRIVLLDRRKKNVYC